MTTSGPIGLLREVRRLGLAVDGSALAADIDHVLSLATRRPKVVCLCGSTRFMEAFQKANLSETMAGRIVLSIGCDTKSDTDFVTVGTMAEDLKRKLDELHKRKIDLSDEVLILNVGGHIGRSTFGELVYAQRHGKAIRWLEPDKAIKPCRLCGEYDCKKD